MDEILTGTQKFVILTCSSCNMKYGVTLEFRDKMIEKRGTFYCPSGHSQWFPGKTEEKRLQGLLTKATIEILKLKRTKRSKKK